MPIAIPPSAIQIGCPMDLAPSVTSVVTKLQAAAAGSDVTLTREEWCRPLRAAGHKLL
jgi:predicted oxidoreductase